MLGYDLRDALIIIGIIVGVILAAPWLFIGILSYAKWVGGILL